ncbi:MAG TPA: hypothetical protein VEX88_01625 [Glaciibacter sp.]|nr:hypothetical protein [Glaciibacter sp.]
MSTPHGDDTTQHPADDATSSVTDDSSVGFGNRLDDEDDSDDRSEPSLQDAHNPETDEDTSSGGPAD